MINIHSSHRPGTRVATRVALPLLATTVALFALTVSAWGNPNPSPYKLCFPQVTGLPGVTYLKPPVIVGTIPSDDAGWANAFRYIFQYGSNLPSGAIQANQQNNMLYFSFQVTQDYDFDQFDAVVIGFDNTIPGPRRYTYIYILPLGPLGTGYGATSGVALASNLIKVYQSSDGSTWGSTISPAWITASASSAGAQTTPTTPVLAWNLLLSINNGDSSGPNLPTTSGSGFGLYMNAIRTWNSYTGPSTNPDTQFTWPPGVELVDDTDPTVSSPATGSWGNGTLDTSQQCSGVYFNQSDIFNTVTGGALHTNQISWTQANTFTVNVHNSSTTAQANNVTATFKIADFGLPSDQNWQLLGLYPPGPRGPLDDSVANNPTAALNVSVATAIASPPGYSPSTQPMIAGPWTLSGTASPPTGNVGYYQNDSDPSNPHTHQCIEVELDSTAGDTTFVNRSTWNNFDFVASASEFKSYPATISANYPAVAGQPNQTFELTASQQEVTPGTNYPVPPGFSKDVGIVSGGEVHYLDYTVTGCRLTGKSLTMEGPPKLNADKRIIGPGEKKTFENCDTVGAYGYLIRHQGPVTVWQSQLTASGTGVQMKTLGNNQYELAIPQGAKAQVVASVTPSTGTGCDGMHFGATALPVLGGIFVVGLLVYRPRKKEKQKEEQKQEQEEV